MMKMHCLFCVYAVVLQGFSVCGMHTTSGTPATVEWYMGLVTNSQMVKKNKIKIFPAILLHRKFN
jgi:hypothetical protein